MPTCPGVYLTDGRRLFSVVVPLSSLESSRESPDIAFLEDCRTLMVHAFTADELCNMQLRFIIPSERTPPAGEGQR